MKKNLTFVVLSIAVLFSLSFLPASGNDLLNSTPKDTVAQSTLAEISFSNPTQYKAQVLLWGLPNMPSYYVYLPPRSAKTIKVKPSSYWVDMKFSTDQCSVKGKRMKITKKTNVTLVCTKPK